MGNLTRYLQQQFEAHCPCGWSCGREVALLPPDLARSLGYAPRADVLFANGEQRLWIEFEVSRADPVANHAKFATSHLFLPQSRGDTFVSMISSHVNRGRRNLAANTIHLMRRIGMTAYQTVLLPGLGPSEICRVNHLSVDEIDLGKEEIAEEIRRVFEITMKTADHGSLSLRRAPDITEVLRNVERWNRDVEKPALRALWGRRRIRYFVFDPFTKEFAPSKFCAFAVDGSRDGLPVGPSMDIASYVEFDEGEVLFDGNVAWRHLVNSLGMPRIDESSVAPHFGHWLAAHEATIDLDRKGPIFIAPPEWY